MEIINTEEIINYTWGWSWFGFIVILLGFIAFVLFVLLDPNFNTPLSIISLVIGITVGLTIFSTAKEMPPIIQYQIILEDDFKANDLLEEYNIIEQRGKSYIIQKKME